MSEELVISLLQQILEDNGRLSYDGNWLVCSGGIWEIYSRKPYAKKTRILVSTPNLAFALQFLLIGQKEG